MASRPSIPATSSQIAKVEIPLSTGPQRTAKAQRRIYDTNPLSTKPSDIGPREARILDRRIDQYGAFYKLQIGDIPMDDVPFEDVLRYVSPWELEEYELKSFDLEEELIRIAEEASSEELSDSEDQVAESNPVVRIELSVPTSSQSNEAPIGRNGRARPSYSHLFPAQKGNARSVEVAIERGHSARGRVVSAQDYQQKRRRRKRDPVTGQLMPLSPPSQRSTSVRRVEALELAEQKRTRRRRHPLTGELMPLGWRYSPDKPDDRLEKHDKTDKGSTMQVDASELAKTKRVKLGEEGPRQLSLVAQSVTQPKQSGKATDLMAHPSLTVQVKDTPRSTPRPGRNNILSILAASDAESSASDEQEEDIVVPMDTSDEHDEEWEIDEILTHRWSNPDTHGPERGEEPVVLYLVKWGTGETSWEPIESFPDRSVIQEYERALELVAQSTDSAMKVDATRSDDREVQSSSAGQSLSNAILLDSDSDSDSHSDSDESMQEIRWKFGLAARPNESVASQAQHRPNPAPVPAGIKSEDESSESGSTTGEDSEYEVESIKAHRLSDPKTHPAGLDSKPVMLYLVKWKGYDELTWEPIGSFQDRAVVDAYRRKQAISD